MISSRPRYIALAKMVIKADFCSYSSFDLIEKAALIAAESYVTLSRTH